jgi:NAD(P)-dependent dehydrogenase (short-subunit alcohol dehydrogenase family)
MEFQDKVAVISGAATGIGRALAKALAREGASVALLDVRRDELDEAVAAVRADGGRAIGVVTDVSDAAAVDEAARVVLDAFGKVHVLVNNAGLVVRGPKLFEVDDNVWKWILGVNLFGVLHCLRTFIPLISANGEGGHILNTGSASGFLSANRQTGVYTTTKYALTGLTECLADELAGAGIGVSLILPGGVKTEFYASSASLRGELGSASPFDAPTAEFADFMPPDEVAARAIAGIKANQFYIATHVEARALHQRRHDELMAAYDAAEAWRPALR